MLRRSALVLGLFSLGFLAELPGLCQPPTRTDRYGDPLPPGVVARLGTERLALPNAVFLTFSPDGRRLAAHNGRDRLQVWDVASGREVLRVTTPALQGHKPAMNPLVFSPDSKTIALGIPGARRQRGKDLSSVHVWDVATGKQRHCFSDLPGDATHVAFSPDGRYLFTGGPYLPPRRWDLLRGGTPKEYGDFPSIVFLAISRDGKTLTATGIENDRDWSKRTFARWEVASGKEIGRHAFPNPGRCVGALSPEGDVFAAPEGLGASIALVDPLTGRERGRVKDSERAEIVSISADGAWMTCTGKDGTVRIWDTATGKLRTRFKGLSTSLSWIALSADGQRVALTGRADDAIHVWDVATGRELHSFGGHRACLLTFAFRKDGKEIATANWYSNHYPRTEWMDWSLRRWDAATGAERVVIRANPKGEVWHTVFSADGRHLAAVTYEGMLRLWDVEAGKELRSWKMPTRIVPTSDDGSSDSLPDTEAISTIAEPVFSMDGQTLLAMESSTLRRWDVATGRELPAFEIKEIARSNWARCLPSRDGRTLVVWGGGSGGRRVLLLNASNGKVQRRLENITTSLMPPAFSPDGRTLAFVEYNVVSLWEVASGCPRGRLKAPSMTPLTFSPDGRFLAAGTDPEAPVTLWDLATGKIVGRLRIDLRWVQSLAFSPDGSRLAVAGISPAVLLCDVAELCGKKKMEEIARISVPSAEELEGLWAELSGAEGAGAYRAIRRLGLSGPRGAAFLKARLKSSKSPDERRIARLIADLDDDKFAKREKASAELGKLGRRAEPALRRALEGEVSAEMRLRINRLLEPLGTPPGSPPSADLIRLRVVEALEANGTEEARGTLAELAKDSANAELMREAKASLERLSRRPALAP
jgi:WD40 repeat protein